MDGGAWGHKESDTTEQLHSLTLLWPLLSDYLRHLPCNAEILPLLPLVVSSLLVQGTPVFPTMLILLIIFIFFFLGKIYSLVSVIIALGFIGSTLTFFA